MIEIIKGNNVNRMFKQQAIINPYSPTRLRRNLRKRSKIIPSEILSIQQHRNKKERLVKHKIYCLR